MNTKLRYFLYIDLWLAAISILAGETFVRLAAQFVTILSGGSFGTFDTSYAFVILVFAFVFSIARKRCRSSPNVGPLSQSAKMLDIIIVAAILIFAISASSNNGSISSEEVVSNYSSYTLSITLSLGGGYAFADLIWLVMKGEK